METLIEASRDLGEKGLKAFMQHSETQANLKTKELELAKEIQSHLLPAGWLLLIVVRVFPSVAVRIVISPLAAPIAILESSCEKQASP